MKKPRPAAEEPQPRKIIRADKAPTNGYSLVVDGHSKSHHDTVEAAEPPRPAASAKKTRAKPKKSGEKGPALSDWLAGQQSGGRRT